MPERRAVPPLDALDKHGAHAAELAARPLLPSVRAPRPWPPRVHRIQLHGHCRASRRPLAQARVRNSRSPRPRLPPPAFSRGCPSPPDSQRTLVATQIPLHGPVLREGLEIPLKGPKRLCPSCVSCFLRATRTASAFDSATHAFWRSTTLRVSDQLQSFGPRPFHHPRRVEQFVQHIVKVLCFPSVRRSSSAAGPSPAVPDLCPWGVETSCTRSRRTGHDRHVRSFNAIPQQLPKALGLPSVELVPIMKPDKFRRRPGTVLRVVCKLIEQLVDPFRRYGERPSSHRF